MTQVYVSLGSNIEPESHICACLNALHHSFSELRCSTIYRTTAVGFAGAAFLNAVVGFHTELSSLELKTWLRQLEEQQGRERGALKFSARTLDLDLLLYAQRIDPTQQLPHADILAYAFVLQPLAELAPEQQHPILGKTFAELAAQQNIVADPLVAVHLTDAAQWQVNARNAS